RADDLAAIRKPDPGAGLSRECGRRAALPEGRGGGRPEPHPCGRVRVPGRRVGGQLMQAARRKRGPLGLPRRATKRSAAALAAAPLAGAPLAAAPLASVDLGTAILELWPDCVRTRWPDGAV